MPRRREVVIRGVLAAALVVLSTTATAQERSAPVWLDWGRVESHAPGRHVAVKRFSGPKVKGTLVSATPEAVVVQSRDGQITIARDAAKAVHARRRNVRRAPWIGLGAGFALGAGLTVGEGDFAQPGAALVYGAAGAGLGYLGGWAVRGLTQNALIYHAPKRARGH